MLNVKYALPMILPVNIDLEQSEKYTLTVRISSSFFSYSIYEATLGGEFFYGEHIIPNKVDQLSEIQSIIFDNNFITNKFKETIVIIVSDKYELVPQSFWNGNESKKLYNFTHRSESEQVIQSVTQLDQNVIYFGIDTNVHSFLIRSLFNPIFVHHSALFLKYTTEKAKATSDLNKMFVNFHHEYVDIACFTKDQKLELILSLRNQNDQNVLYHILNSWTKCGLNQINDILYLFNPISTNREILKLLKDYIKHIQILDLPNEIDLFNIEDSSIIPLDMLISVAS